MQKRVFIAVIFVFILTNFRITALPNSAISLPVLIDQSDVVAFVNVDSIDRWERSADGMNFSTKSLATAFLSVSQVYKGELDKKKLDIGYMANLTCPSPPQFNKSDNTIVFLSKDSTSGNYSVLWLSYGTKIVNDVDEYKAYQDAIISYLKLKVGSEENKVRAWHDWIKTCCQNEYLINEIDILFNSLRHSKKLIKQIKKEYRQYNFDEDLLNVFLKRTIRERNDLSVLNFLPKKYYLSIKKKLINVLSNNPYSENLNYSIMNKLIDLNRTSKSTKAIAQAYYNIDIGALWDDDFMNKEPLNSKKPEAIAVYKEMAKLTKQFIASLD